MVGRDRRWLVAYFKDADGDLLAGGRVSCLVCFGYEEEGGVQAEGASVARAMSARIA